LDILSPLALIYQPSTGKKAAARTQPEAEETVLPPVPSMEMPSLSAAYVEDYVSSLSGASDDARSNISSSSIPAAQSPASLQLEMTTHPWGDVSCYASSACRAGALGAEETLFGMMVDADGTEDGHENESMQGLAMPLPVPAVPALQAQALAQVQQLQSSFAALAMKTPLMLAVAQGFAESVHQLLGQPGVQVNARDQHGQTALHQCVLAFNPARVHVGKGILAALLKAGARPNQADAEMSTPLMYACRLGFTPLIEELLASGASVACVDSSSMSVYMMAVTYNRVSALRMLVELDSSFLNARDDKGRTALHWAVAVGSLGCIQTLVEQDGADFNIKDTPNEETPLHYAARLGNLEVARALIAGIPQADLLLVKSSTNADELEAEQLARCSKNGVSATAGMVGKSIAARAAFGDAFAVLLASALATKKRSRPRPRPKCDAKKQRPKLPQGGARVESEDVLSEAKPNMDSRSPIQPGQPIVLSTASCIYGGGRPLGKSVLNPGDSSSIVSGADSPGCSSGRADGDAQLEMATSSLVTVAPKGPPAGPGSRRDYMRQRRLNHRNETLVMEKEVDGLSKVNSGLKSSLAAARREVNLLRAEVAEGSQSHHSHERRLLPTPPQLQQHQQLEGFRSQSPQPHSNASDAMAAFDSDGTSETVASSSGSRGSLSPMLMLSASMQDSTQPSISVGDLTKTNLEIASLGHSKLPTDKFGWQSSSLDDLRGGSDAAAHMIGPNVYV
jgi:ankyrin repeat protein